MVKRSKASLEDVVDWCNLVQAASRAGKGKRDRIAVRRFFSNFDFEINRLRDTVLSGNVRLGEFRRFLVHDPKPREICAPAFRERVLHHALINVIGPTLDRVLIDDTYACRIGKGSLAAVKRVQHHARRYSWFGKLDVRKFFGSVLHSTLAEPIERRIKDQRLLDLIWQVIDCYHETPGRGLPIGTLTSQNFANFYLSGFDHWLAGQTEVRGTVRYMDDVVRWCDCGHDAREIADRATQYLDHKLSLAVRDPIVINRSNHGVTYCGYRVFPGTIKLTQRRKRRYQHLRAECEYDFRRGT
ncbi:MAG: reverse transcriptase domain-containing protein, partial [Planctomycetota bacterium]